MLVHLYYAQLNTFRCQDSLIVDRGNFGTTEVCGSRTLELNSSRSSVLNLQPQSFTILFRTSEEVRGKGFQMYVICFKDEPLEGNVYVLFSQNMWHATVLCHPLTADSLIIL